MKLSDYLQRESCLLDIKASAKEEVIRELAVSLMASGKVKDKEKFIGAILERERLGSTGIGNNVAIPHAPTDAVDGFVIAFGRSKKGIDFGALDGDTVNLIFLMGTGPHELHLYLRMLARLSKLLLEDVFRKELSSAKTPEEVIDIFKRRETGQGS